MFIHYFKVFGYITTQAVITIEITEKIIIRIYKIEVFEYINICHNFEKIFKKILNA